MIVKCSESTTCGNPLCHHFISHETVDCECEVQCPSNSKARCVPENSMTEFETLVRPLIKWLNDNHNPHSKILITPTSAELLSGEITIPCEDYVKD
jgi:hypothetical protein